MRRDVRDFLQRVADHFEDTDSPLGEQARRLLGETTPRFVPDTRGEQRGEK